MKNKPEGQSLSANRKITWQASFTAGTKLADLLTTLILFILNNLEKMGVQEMDAEEMRNENGGGITWATATIIAGACIYVYNNWDDFVAGVKEGYEETRN